jgi:hypothetical protein
MNELLRLDLIARGADSPLHPDYDLERSGSCAAALYRTASRWDKSSLAIKWDSVERAFTVDFKASGNIEVPLGEVLSKRIPLEIARASNCECGSVLQLGDYSVIVEDADFRFQADYFCPVCKRRLLAEKKGFKRLIETWATGLKKIEVKATGVGGVGFERV